MIYVVGPNPTSLSFFKLKLLEKSVAQYGIKASFSDKSYVRISLPYIYIPHLLSPKEVDCGCLPIHVPLHMSKSMIYIVDQKCTSLRF